MRQKSRHPEQPTIVIVDTRCDEPAATGAGTACVYTSACVPSHTHASCWWPPVGAAPFTLTLALAHPPFHRRLRPGADDLLGASQAGVKASAWLCSGPDSSDTGAAVLALVIYEEPLIIHAAAIHNSQHPFGRLLFVVACATRLHAHSACSRALPTPTAASQPAHDKCSRMQGAWWDHLGQLTARFVGGPSLRRAVRLHHVLLTAHEPRHEPASARVLPSGEPCCTPR